MSSLKVNNNIAAHLKIFFERSNKLNSTVTSFGNVFKNSKWSDFQTQNIKKSFGKDWFFLILCIVVPAAIFYYFKFLPLVQLLTFIYVLKQMFFDLVYDFYYLVLYFCLQQSFFFQGSAQSFGPNHLSRAKQRSVSTAFSAPVFGIQGSDKLSHINSQVPLIFKTSGALNRAGLDLLSASPTQTNHLLPQETVTGGSSLLFNLNSSSYILTNQLNSNFSRVINFSTQHNTSSSAFLNKNPYTHSYLTSQLLSSTKQYR
jgi:hypothetical protein